jgi:hypothetical protein
VFEQNVTAKTASSLQYPPKRASINSTSNLFKKQRLRLNPTFAEAYVSKNALLQGIEGKPTMAANDDYSFLNDNSFQQEIEFDNNSFSSADQYSGAAEESDYACFTTSQKCITALMYLLDNMECPDYAF